MPDTYDAQIDALLSHDYQAFWDLIYPEEEGGHHGQSKDHFEMWNSSGAVSHSLFAFLPQEYVCGLCASTIEHISLGSVAGRLAEIRSKLIAGGPSLPNMQTSEFMDPSFEVPSDAVALSRSQNRRSFKFTREQLEEFARRQRLARSML